MSRFREIWGLAILAGQKMMLDPQAGELSFGELLGKHPRDGMIFYERGEALEHLGRLKLAERDYQKAEDLLPLGHWKAVARRSLARVQHKLISRNPGPGEHLQWDAFHYVHSVPRAPHKVRVRALSALARIDSEVASALTDLRSCLEEVVLDQLRHVPRTKWRDVDDFAQKISALRSHRGCPSNVANDMRRLWRVGSDATHAGRDVRALEVDFSIKAFVRILRYFYGGSAADAARTT